MRTIAALQAWENFSEYYSKWVGQIIKPDYELTITYNHDPEYLKQFDIIWAFFPQDPKTNIPKEKIVKTFWEWHELGWKQGKVNVACSLYVYRNLKRRDPNALFASFGVDTGVFVPGPFQNTTPVVGWCGQEDNKRKRFPELSALMSEIPSITFKPNLTKVYGGLVKGAYADVPAMNGYYNTIDMYVCASVAEGLGLPFLEASACGRPIVTFDVGIARELKQDGAGIIIVDTFEEMKAAIEKLAGNRGLIAELGAKSRKAMEEYWPWARLGHMWLKVFDSI